MGGRGSGRWNNHKKAALVEESLAIDLPQLRREGLFDKPPGTTQTISWTLGYSSEVIGEALVALVPVEAGEEALLVVCRVPWRRAMGPLHVLLPIVRRGHRRCLQCQDCHEAFAKLYLTEEQHGVRCRGCHGLQYRSAQRHDSRFDQARRDPQGFITERARLHGLGSAWATMRLIERVLMWPPGRTPGRTWGGRSVTTFTRAIAEL